jgi:hypothetical protein
LSMKVGDLVKYTREHKDLQYLTGIVVGTSNERIRHGHVRVLWSDNPDPIWDWTSQLEVISESR